ncbi:MAG: PQQ-binding-like beta-propeller repeat protein [Actinobacteria bacterium]|nr:PQQ-binding-like beta-propeller repeat protein [Actinomycetota bacterium]
MGEPIDLRRPVVRRVLICAAAIAAVVATTATPVGSAPDDPTATACGTGSPPEEVAEPEGWVLPNGDPANTREAGVSAIDTSTIGDIEEVWRYDVPGSAAFGNLTTNPVVSDGTVYVGALDGSTHALSLEDGTRTWANERHISIFGPAGVSIGWGKVYGISTATTVVAQDADTGATVWTRDLGVGPGNQIDMAPSLVGGCVLISTQALAPGSRGTLYALDHRDGRIVWQFETVPDDFWGNPSVNHGGGAWYSPAVDPATGRSWWGTSNPWPSPGAPGFPAGSSRPGDNLYTDSALALGADGSLDWYHQVFQHDIWDRDMVLTQLVDLPGGGRVVVHTGKGGRVLAYDPDTGAVRWDVPVGMHQNDDLTTFTEPTTVMPGVLGGVETPPAAADGKIYLSVMNAPTTYDSPEQRFALNPQLGTNPSHLIALDASTGATDWQVDLPGDSLGGVTVVNDLLLTSTFGGLLLAYDRTTGAEVWRHQAGGVVNGSPAVVGNTIVWPVSGTSPSQLVAFRLDAPLPTGPTTTTTTTTTTSEPTTTTTTGSGSSDVDPATAATPTRTGASYTG